MGLTEFENKYVGQQIGDNHDNYIGECVSYVKRYAQEVQGVPNADSVLYVRGDLAKNMYLNPNPPSLEYYDTVSSGPQRGDIAVYGKPGDNSYGDVAVVLSPTQVIGQLGFPLYYPIAVRNIGNPIGFLRRKGSDMPYTDEQYNALKAKCEGYAEDWARQRYILGGRDPNSISQAERRGRLDMTVQQAGADLDRDLPVVASPYELMKDATILGKGKYIVP